MNVATRLTWLTRVGFAVRGVLYLVIAILIARLGRAEDPGGAVQYLGAHSGILLIVIAAGLIAYGVWRLADAAFNVERHDDDAKGVAERVGAALSGAVHFLLAWQAIHLFQGARASGDSTEQGVRMALDLPAGPALVVVAGILLAALGVYQLVRAAKGSFLKHLEPRIARHPWAKWSGRLGYAARGVIFALSGWFIVQAGLEADADQAGGMAQALAWLESPVDLLVAAGLFGFGLFSLIEARFRVLRDVRVG
ncbi:DUF1206 domain-containing protein [Sphingomonas sp. ST-64]|uniref:DUF1206 domain-containing protein n=1 Tax=Sphingomonas plantiphila TaxID=3163295 RepID=A0ABW8YM73_9SPHN